MDSRSSKGLTASEGKLKRVMGILPCGINYLTALLLLNSLIAKRLISFSCSHALSVCLVSGIIGNVCESTSKVLVSTGLQSE